MTTSPKSLKRFVERFNRIVDGFTNFDDVPADVAKARAYQWMASAGCCIVEFAEHNLLILPGIEDVVRRYHTARIRDGKNVFGCSEAAQLVFERVIGYPQKQGKSLPGLISCVAPDLPRLYLNSELDFWTEAVPEIADACKALIDMVESGLEAKYSSNPTSNSEPISASTQLTNVEGVTTSSQPEPGNIPPEHHSNAVSKTVAAKMYYNDGSVKTKMRRLETAMNSGELRFIKVGNKLVFDCRQIGLQRSAQASMLYNSLEQKNDK